MLRYRRLALALALAAASGTASAADLTVYWLKGFYPEEDQALEALVRRYEQKTGKTIQLTLSSQAEHAKVVAAASAAGEAPDVAQGNFLSPPRLAHEDALADLSDVVEPVKAQFSPGVLDRYLLVNGHTDKRGYYGVPFYQFPINIHVWKSLLDQAGIGIDEIPREWGPFWSFWCDTVQPAVRKATGRNDVYGIGLAMSDWDDAFDTLEVFHAALGADEYVMPDGKLRLDEPAIRLKLIQGIADYTAIYKKGCTPPESASWDNSGNNKAFLARQIVMTVNTTLSIPNALRAKQPDDYYQGTTTIEWPMGPSGKPYGLVRGVYGAIVFKDAKHVEQAKDFLRFLLQGGELGPYIEASLGRGLPAMPALLDTPFWQDPADTHRRMAAKLIAAWPALPSRVALDWRWATIDEERVWGKAIHRVAAEGMSPEQAADEAIARVKQIMGR